MVVFLSPSTASKADDRKLADKESILASLNLKAMSFDDAVGMLSESTRNAFAGLEFHEGPQVERRGSAYGCNVPIVTEVGKCYFGNREAVLVFVCCLPYDGEKGNSSHNLRSTVFSENASDARVREKTRTFISRD